MLSAIFSNVKFFTTKLIVIISDAILYLPQVSSYEFVLVRTSESSFSSNLFIFGFFEILHSERNLETEKSNESWFSRKIICPCLPLNG